MLKIEVYDSTGAIVPDPTGDLARAGSLTFETAYPGGLFQLCSFYLSRPIDGFLPVYGGNRVIVRDGYTLVYEGYVDSLEYTQDNDSAGVLVKCVGAWARIAMKRYYQKYWTDKRITDDIWPAVASYTLAKYHISRTSTTTVGTITVTPLAGYYTATEYMAIVYSTPTAADPAKRIYYAYNLTTGGYSWDICLEYSSDGSTWAIRSGTTVTGGSGVIDVSLPDYADTTGRQYIRIRLTSTYDQTLPYTGLSSLTLYDINVWSELDSITLTNIAKFVVGKETDLNSNTAYIGTNTYALTEYTIDDWKSYADILVGAADFGDTSYNRWVVGMLPSDYGTPNNGKPVLFAESWPDVNAGYDYVVRLDEINLVAPVNIQQDIGIIENWVNVKYLQSTGEERLITPLIDATLQDATSIANYGRRETLFDGKQALRSDALNAAKRYLKQYKDPQWRLDNGLQITGWIRTTDGAQIPACQIRAGKRLRIEDFTPDAPAWSWGSAATMVITKTVYDDETQTANLSFGEPDDMLFAAWSGKYGVEDEEGHDLWRLYQGVDGYDYKMARLNAQFKNRHGRWNRHNGSGIDPQRK